MPSASTKWRRRRRPLVAALILIGAMNALLAGDRIRILIQNSPLAGSQHYALDRLQGQIRVGDEVELVREPTNPHDSNAVMVRWRGEQLGYLPRRENRSVARAMDEGMKLRASVSRLTRLPSAGPGAINPWQRLEVAVHVEL